LEFTPVGLIVDIENSPQPWPSHVASGTGQSLPAIILSFSEPDNTAIPFPFARSNKIARIDITAG
jgi:hypothetical protein